MYEGEGSSGLEDAVQRQLFMMNVKQPVPVTLCTTAGQYVLRMVIYMRPQIRTRFH